MKHCWEHEKCHKTWNHPTRSVLGMSYSLSCEPATGKEVCGKMVPIWSKARYAWVIIRYPYALCQAIFRSSDNQTASHKTRLSRGTTTRLLSINVTKGELIRGIGRLQKVVMATNQGLVFSTAYNSTDLWMDCYQPLMHRKGCVRLLGALCWYRAHAFPHFYISTIDCKSISRLSDNKAKTLVSLARWSWFHRLGNDPFYQKNRKLKTKNPTQAANDCQSSVHAVAQVAHASPPTNYEPTRAVKPFYLKVSEGSCRPSRSKRASCILLSPSSLTRSISCWRSVTDFQNFCQTYAKPALMKQANE